jgi:excisionase family DNA binding protein
LSRPLPEYLTAAEAAQILRLAGPYRVSRLCQAGKLKAHKPEGTLQWLIDPADLKAYIEGTDSQDVA